MKSLCLSLKVRENAATAGSSQAQRVRCSSDGTGGRMGWDGKKRAHTKVGRDSEKKRTGDIEVARTSQTASSGSWANGKLGKRPQATLDG